MKSVLIIGVILAVIVIGVFLLAITNPNLRENKETWFGFINVNPDQNIPTQQQNLEGTNEEQRDKIIWQQLQKTYLEQECREKYIGQLDEMEECFERVKEEQRLNPPGPIAEKESANISSQECSGTARCITGTVTSVIDGDTIKVDGQSIRFALASAPELKGYGGVESRDFIQTICPVGSTVLVDEDDGQTGENHGRIIGVIYCNGVNLNSELLDANLGYMEIRFCDSSEFGNDSWAQKHGC
jgi:endonuclease YncB( thermonuclease family)